MKVTVVESEHDQKFHPVNGTADFTKPVGITPGKLKGTSPDFEVAYGGIYRLVTVEFPIREFTVRVSGPKENLVKTKSNNGKSIIEIFDARMHVYEVSFLK